jgi:hypothetical protein
MVSFNFDAYSSYDRDIWFSWVVEFDILEFNLHILDNFLTIDALADLGLRFFVLVESNS